MRPASPAAALCCVGASVGTAHRAAYARSHGRPALCSVRRQAKQQGVPARLFASHNRGGVPELGGHRRQVVRRQCDRCDRAVRLFLAQRRRRRLPQHSFGWQCEPQFTAAVRRCAAVARSHAPQSARREESRTPSPHTHASCDGACRRAVAAALLLIAVTNPPL
jgi:hypothetical protein